ARADGRTDAVLRGPRVPHPDPRGGAGAPQPRRRDPRGNLRGRPRAPGGPHGPHTTRAVGEDAARRLLAPPALPGWAPLRYDAPGGPALPARHRARPSPRGRGDRR